MKVRHWFLAQILLLAVLLTGCGKPAGTNTAEFEKAFHLAKGAKGAPEDPAIKAACEETLAALKASDLPRAMGSLGRLRYTQGLTVDQEIAVQNLLGGVQVKLADKAEHGDKAAIEAIANMKRNSGRR